MGAWGEWWWGGGFTSKHNLSFGVGGGHAVQSHGTGIVPSPLSVFVLMRRVLTSSNGKSSALLKRTFDDATLKTVFFFLLYN